MKRLITITAIVIAIAAAAGIGIAATRPKTEDKMIDKLWKEYKSWLNADRPQKQLETLDKIKSLAKEEGLAWDYYRAVCRKADLRREINWKDDNDARKDLKADILDYNLPIMVYSWMDDHDRGNVDNYATENKGSLSSTSNPDFWTGVSDFLAHYIRNDYEYTLWHRIFRTWGNDFYKIRDELKLETAGHYPNAEYLEYYLVTRYTSSAQKEPFERLDKQYEGKAIGLLPRQALLKIEFNQLEKDNASSDQFKAFHAKCKEFERYRASFKGDERYIADICTNGKDLIETLESKDISVTTKDEKVTVVFRNISKTPIAFYRAKEDSLNRKLWSRTLENPTGSFYRRDTVEFTLPPTDDGYYCIKASPSGIEPYLCYYRHYTLSLGVRTDSIGPEIYVADYLSGKPVKKVTAELLLKGKVVKSAEMELDGFTRLPEAFTTLLRKDRDKYYYIQVRTKGEDGLEKASQKVSVKGEGYFYDSSSAYVRTRCNIYKDKGAYNSGETVHFKAILFEGDLLKRNNVLPGVVLSARLLDSEYNKLEEKTFTTNEYGSIAGEFVLPKGLRNGNFSIRIYKEDREMASDRFPVGDFVLPTFTASFDPIEGIFFPGDEVQVTGKVETYSGLPLADASIMILLQNYHLQTEIEDVQIDKKGNFKMVIPCKWAGYNHVTARITDATGETQEFSTGFLVLDTFTTRMEPLNASDGSFALSTDKPEPYRWSRYHYDNSGRGIITEPKPEFKVTVKNTDGKEVEGIPVEYSLLDAEGEVRIKGKALSGTTVVLDMENLDGGYYALQVDSKMKGTDGKERKSSYQYRFLKVLPGETKVWTPVSRMFVPTATEVRPGEKFGALFGGADGTLWAVVTLYGVEGTKLKSWLLESPDGMLSDISFVYEDKYPDAVRMQIFFFKDGQEYNYNKEFRRDRDVMALPLEFDSFTDKAGPATKYRITLKTDPGVEALAAVFDKSIDAIQRNNWPIVTMYTFSVSSVWVSASCGAIGDYYEFSNYTGGGLGAGRKMLKSAVALEAEPMMVMEESAVERRLDNSASEDDVSDVAVREKFETALAFEPFLNSGSDGVVTLDFSTSDKLTTYYVYVYAHDKNMRNAFVQRTFQVSSPVKVSLTEPTVLREGDLYNAAVAVSSAAGKDLSGKLYFFVYDGGNPSGEALSAQMVPLKVKDHDSASSTFKVKVPVGVKSLLLKAVFKADGFSDAIQVPVPVEKGEQTLTEAHSAVWLSGMVRSELEKELRSRFVNIAGSKASYSEITVLDMVRDAIAAKEKPDGKDVLSLSEAWYVAKMAEKLGVSVPENDYMEKIMACHNSDGGFGWFEGLDSSPMITAVLLERFAKIARHGFEVPDMADAVKYLDKQQFRERGCYWRGYLSDNQYLYVRSLYPGVTFSVSAFGDLAIFNQSLKEFKEYAKEYLVPKEDRGLQGQIFSKARRLATLDNLSASSDGIALAKAWGIGLSAMKKVTDSADSDVASLLEYAVPHRDGGYYFPNAVMPWRGLMESEAYAHSLIADLLWKHGDVKSSTISTKAVSEGIRLWLMLQKETQKWDSDPAFLDAINTILSGSPELLETKIMVLKATFTAPITKIKAAGNGFTIRRKFLRGDNVLSTGDKIYVGDKITAIYEIWNQENRSFVKVNAPHEGALRPVEQKSGYYQGGYRDVRTDRTEYYFPSYPEEDTTIREEFFVTSEGTFIAPVVTIESLYANHYRANDGFPGKFVVSARNR